VVLTGDAIRLSDVRNKITNIWTSYPIVWIFLVIVLFLFVWASFKKWSHGKRFSFLEPSRGMKEYAKKTGGVMVINPEKVDKEIDRVLLNGEVRKAEQVTVMHGQKSNAAVIAIKVKNDIGGIAQDAVEESLEYAYKNKAVSYMSGEYILLIFSPLLTKTGGNEGLAIKAAIDIDNSLKEHNRKYRTNPVIYGLGVNSGEILNRLNGKILQFTSMGKTINLAKRVADVSDSQLLLSKDIREKASSNFKLEKVASSKSGNMDLFTIKRAVNTEESSKFINEFVKRNEFKDKNQNSPKKYL
jgi:class 3 adenylate cyclase